MLRPHPPHSKVARAKTAVHGRLLLRGSSSPHPVLSCSAAAPRQRPALLYIGGLRPAECTMHQHSKNALLYTRVVTAKSARGGWRPSHCYFSPIVYGSCSKSAESSNAQLASPQDGDGSGPCPACISESRRTQWEKSSNSRALHRLWGVCGARSGPRKARGRTVETGKAPPSAFTAQNAACGDATDAFVVRCEG